ncbi:hypothetical protein PIB30_055022 [Stylosanthes scabra]|uniref:Uncharacterized protein n=1 Tax=Stylosanthes scabra TaxID=79078 RepID=A0ABU6RJ98_9FABA|nr:hypothetical protein [Stylosanthes scabra]
MHLPVEIRNPARISANRVALNLNGVLNGLCCRVCVVPRHRWKEPLLHESPPTGLYRKKEPKTCSPVIDSNSPHGVASRHMARSSVARTSLRFPKPTKTYARRGKKAKQEKWVEHDVVPPMTAMSSSDNGTFRFTRTNARGWGVRCGEVGSGSKVPAEDYPEWSGPEELKKNVTGTTCVTTSTHRLPFDYRHPNYLQQKDTDTSKWVDDISNVMPKALSMLVTFIPTLDMEIVGLHLALAAFIFNKSLDPKEIVVRIANYDVTHSTLRSLEHGQMVRDEVLTLLARLLSKDSGEEHWFLPTNLTELASNQKEVPADMIARVTKGNMGKLNICCLDADRKMGPRLAQRRYRAVKNLVSIPCVSRPCSWRTLPMKMTGFDDPEAERLEFSDFKFKIPSVPQKDPGRLSPNSLNP